MFTGIITDLGEIQSLHQTGDLRAVIGCHYDMSSVDIGASIACNGVCLTVVEKTAHSFAVDISAESVGLTNIGDWAVGTPVNLERALRLGDELGGHIVSGHVDGVAELTDMIDEGDSTRMVFQVPGDLAKFVAPKGSVALNGTSLTVNQVDGASFGVNIIPHTKTVTTWGQARVGDRINFEIDTLARYVARLNEYS